PPLGADDRELGLPDTASAHPREGPPHHDAPEADLPPPIADRDPDGSDVTGLREPPAMTVRRADRLSVRVGDEEDRSHAVEGSEPLPLLVEVRTDLIDEDEDPFAPDEIHVPEKRLRVAQAGRPDADPPPVPEGDDFRPHPSGPGPTAG